MPWVLGACNALDEWKESSEPLPEKREGQIPDRLFAFEKVTEPDKADGGGWWVGCLHLQLDRGPGSDESSRVACDFEYGFPIVTEKRRVSLGEAQEAAARATNEAIAQVPRVDRMTAEICLDLHAEILRQAGLAINGSRLHKKCGSTKGTVPEFSWP